MKFPNGIKNLENVLACISAERFLSCFVTEQAWLDHTKAMMEQHAWRYDYPGEKVFAPYLLNQLSQRMPSNGVVCCDVAW